MVLYFPNTNISTGTFRLNGRSSLKHLPSPKTPKTPKRPKRQKRQNAKKSQKNLNQATFETLKYPQKLML